MKYRTSIEIISEAKNDIEAYEIAGEFLRGNLESGIKMKCRTKPLRSHIFLQTSVILLFISLLMAIAAVASVGVLKSAPVTLAGTNNRNTSAFQPPLRTGHAGDFYGAWQEQGNKKALEHIKKQ